MKRKRGAQPGNQNARKHGLYSPTLSAAEIDEVRNITNLKGIDPEIALVRLKLQSYLRSDPDNPRVLGQTSRLLARWCRTKYRLNQSDSRYLKAFIDSILYVSLVLRPFDPALSLPDGINDRLTDNTACTERGRRGRNE